MTLPPICRCQPENDSIYCTEHAQMLRQHGLGHSKTELQELRRQMDPGELAAVFGAPGLFELFRNATKDSVELKMEENVPYECTKQTSRPPKKKKIVTTRKMPNAEPIIVPVKSPRSLGIFAIVRPCGHVNSVVPLYKSESPTQAFLALISALYIHIQEYSVPPENYKDIFVIYDNVCNLDRIAAAKNELPFPPPFDRMYLDVSKAIDVFHHKNHVREECRTGIYSPVNIRSVYPDLKRRNTEAAEQLNAWLNRFTAFLNPMPMERQLFCLDRLVHHRNLFIHLKNGGAFEVNEEVQIDDA